MRKWRALLLAGVAGLLPSTALAADAVKTGPAPDWVHPQPIPTAKPTDAPVQMLLRDEQVSLVRGKVTEYSEGAIRIQTSQGLDAGNLAVVWQPATDTLTVNKLHIIRDGKVIDVLASGQTFTVLRRETNLDAAMLDGTLTATIQPEGLQEGDILDFATTLERSDPVLKGHVEAIYGAWGGLPIQSAHASVQWPTDLKLNLRQTPDLPQALRSSGKGVNMLELKGQDVQPLVAPNGAPDRFKIGRLAEATDFASWSDLADLMSPLFRSASVIPASGLLHDEVEKIRAATTDPQARATQALALVQERVRYVALLMGQGGYVPATAEQTWSRRFGDCKAKTALLLGVLQSLGIKAEPVIVQAKLGDMVADRLPMIGLFNHVLVRAHVGGKDYWLDGTRTGDTDLNAIEIPDFGWGLPLVEHAQLVHLIPRPLDVPSVEHRVSMDASGGVYAAVPITIQEIHRGDIAVAMNALYSAVTAEQRDEAMHDTAKGYFDGFTISSSSTHFDKATRTFDVTIKGSAKLSWKDGWFYIPTSSIGFDPDFHRAASPFHDVPLAVAYPSFVKDVATIRLPAGFAAKETLAPAVHDVLAGVEYVRNETASGDTIEVDSSERSIAPEVAYKDALAAEPRLRSLNKDDLYLRMIDGYHGTPADLAAVRETKPDSATDFFLRADMLAGAGKFDEAMTDLDAGLALDPKNSWALQKRAAINGFRQHFGAAEKDLQAAGAEDPGDANVIAARGTLAMGKGDITGAAAAFDQALVRDPKNITARIGRASLFLVQDKQDEALKEIATVLASYPNNARALALRARTLDGRNDRAGADRDIAAAIAADPDDPVVMATRAGIAVNRRDYETAKQFVSKALARDPDNPYARNLQTQLMKRDGTQAAGMAPFDAAVAAAPKDPTPLLNRAGAYADAKNFDAADRDVSAALVLDPGNLRALDARAEIASLRGNYADAVEALNAALARVPGNSGLLAARAQAYSDLRKFDPALADTQAAMKAGLVSPSLRLLRINILMSKGDIPAVGPEVDSLVSENPTSDYALVAAGKTYAAIGQRDKATASFDRAIALKPLAYIYINRSQIRPHDDLDGKLADLDKALTLEPDDESTLSQKAWLLSRAGRHAAAIQLYDRAIKTALDTSDLELWRGIALQKAGRAGEAKAALDAWRAKAKTAGEFSQLCRAQASEDVLLETALQDCRHAVSLDPELPGLNDNLGLVLLKLGKFQDALAAYDKAIAEHSGAEAYLVRAIIHQRLHDTAAAQADAAMAHRLRADIDDVAADDGLKFDGGPRKIARAASN